MKRVSWDDYVASIKKAFTYGTVDAEKLKTIFKGISKKVPAEIYRDLVINTAERLAETSTEEKARKFIKDCGVEIADPAKQEKEKGDWLGPRPKKRREATED